MLCSMANEESKKKKRCYNLAAAAVSFCRREHHACMCAFKMCGSFFSFYLLIQVVLLNKKKWVGKAARRVLVNPSRRMRLGKHQGGRGHKQHGRWWEKYTTRAREHNVEQRRSTQLRKQWGGEARKGKHNPEGAGAEAQGREQHRSRRSG